jgi:ankyrin repeat protein
MKYIKLFEEHSYSVYDLILMDAEQSRTLLLNEIKKKDPDLELVKDILAYSVVDVNSKDSFGYTALMQAAYWGKEKCVELLLNHPGIDRTLKNKDGDTAWDLAYSNIIQKFPQLNPDVL